MEVKTEGIGAWLENNFSARQIQSGFGRVHISARGSISQFG
jgi:hypothetical protein